MAVRPPARAASRISFVVDADLQVEDTRGRTMTITVHNGRGTIVVPRTALRLSSLRALPGDRGRWAAEVQRLIGPALEIDVLCEQRTIARLSFASSGNWFARLLGLGPVDISLPGVIAALVLGRPR
jgi:hypothetical protein